MVHLDTLAPHEQSSFASATTRERKHESLLFREVSTRDYNSETIPPVTATTDSDKNVTPLISQSHPHDCDVHYLIGDTCLTTLPDQQVSPRADEKIETAT
jgi:hypothetical protein